ncbi:hypothetical protein RND81_09G102500, partial [Saponaria officinalis]
GEEKVPNNDDVQQPLENEQPQPNENVIEETNAPEQPQLRRGDRERRPSTRYSPEEYELIADEGEPQNYKEVLTSDYKEDWEKAMQEEMQSLHDNYTYDLVELPKGKRALICKGTSNRCFCFGKDEHLLKGYCDVDMAGDKLQKCVALSTTEAEYIASAEACKEMLWLKNFLLELGQKQERYILVCDSQSAIYLAKNPTYHSRSKHIDVRYHWIRDMLEDKKLQLDKVHTDDNWSDMMTKTISTKKFDDCCDGSGVVMPTN